MKTKSPLTKVSGLIVFGKQSAMTCNQAANLLAEKRALRIKLNTEHEVKHLTRVKILHRDGQILFISDKNGA
jgi:hypothetical protein